MQRAVCEQVVGPWRGHPTVATSPPPAPTRPPGSGLSPRCERHAPAARIGRHPSPPNGGPPSIEAPRGPRRARPSPAFGPRGRPAAVTSCGHFACRGVGHLLGLDSVPVRARVTGDPSCRRCAIGCADPGHSGSLGKPFRRRAAGRDSGPATAPRDRSPLVRRSRGRTRSLMTAGGCLHFDRRDVTRSVRGFRAGEPCAPCPQPPPVRWSRASALPARCPCRGFGRARWLPRQPHGMSRGNVSRSKCY